MVMRIFFLSAPLLEKFSKLLSMTELILFLPVFGLEGEGGGEVNEGIHLSFMWLKHSLEV